MNDREQRARELLASVHQMPPTTSRTIFYAEETVIAALVLALADEAASQSREGVGPFTSHPREKVRPAYSQAMVDLIDAYEQRIWKWAQGCEIDGIQQRSAIGDSYNEGQRGEAAKARIALIRQIDALTTALDTAPTDQAQATVTETVNVATDQAQGGGTPEPAPLDNAEIVERCAAVADRYAQHMHGPAYFASRDIAAAIRALATPIQGEI